MALEIHTWWIEGVSPLVQNNPACMDSLAPSPPKKKSGVKAKTRGSAVEAGKKEYDPAEEAGKRVYRNNGVFFHPTTGFRAGILEAAKGRKINKRAARTVLAGAVFPTDEEFVLKHPQTKKPLKSYDQYVTRCVVNNAGIARVRPLFSKWAGELEMEIDRDFITNLETVTEMLNISGRIMGVGEHRPDTSKGKSGVGTKGRYKATLIK